VNNLNETINQSINRLRVGAVPPHANISHKLECDVAAVDLLSSLKSMPAAVRACNVVDDVVKLTNCTLLAPDLEDLFVASLAELLLYELFVAFTRPSGVTNFGTRLHRFIFLVRSRAIWPLIGVFHQTFP
jgi:hypothetical protein